MKMTILELEYSNIRKITTLRLPFTRADGSVIKHLYYDGQRYRQDNNNDAY